MTLKALRMEVRGAEPEAAIAGSAVRKYASQFSAVRQTAAAGAEAASDSFIAGATDPFADPAEE
jgi:hypothetical protein